MDVTVFPLPLLVEALSFLFDMKIPFFLFEFGPPVQ